MSHGSVMSHGSLLTSSSTFPWSLNSKVQLQDSSQACNVITKCEQVKLDSYADENVFIAIAATIYM